MSRLCSLVLIFRLRSFEVRLDNILKEGSFARLDANGIFVSSLVSSPMKPQQSADPLTLTSDSCLQEL